MMDHRDIVIKHHHYIKREDRNWITTELANRDDITEINLDTITHFHTKYNKAVAIIVQQLQRHGVPSAKMSDGTLWSDRKNIPKIYQMMKSEQFQPIYHKPAINAQHVPSGSRPASHLSLSRQGTDVHTASLNQENHSRIPPPIPPFYALQLNDRSRHLYNEQQIHSYNILDKLFKYLNLNINGVELSKKKIWSFHFETEGWKKYITALANEAEYTRLWKQVLNEEEYELIWK